MGYMASAWSRLNTDPKYSSAQRRITWTQNRNWLKRCMLGNLARIQNMLHELQHCLSDDEKVEMDHILDLMKDINDKWRERQADMIRTIK